MIVLFRPSPKSMVKAFLASRLRKAKPVEDLPSNRFYFEETVEADSLDYDALYAQYKEAFGGLDFLEDQKLWEIVEDEVFWASRFNSPDRFQLVFRVLQQIERTGTKAYLAQQSPEAKEMKDRVRRVTGEFRRAKQFIAFAEDPPNKVLIGKASLEHRILDLVLRHHAKRNPGLTIALLDDEHAHICYKDEILIEARNKFPERPGRRDSARFWMLLTDLRHLESKKDREYYGWEKPTSYDRWISEGAESLGAPPRVTLDDFGT